MKPVYIIIFTASLLLGMILVYLSPIEYKTVMVYPTPHNVKTIQYQDSTDSCFRFSAKLVDCNGTAKPIPSTIKYNDTI